MSKNDWVAVGLKLLGVYFAVIGFTVLCVTGINLLAEMYLPAAPPHVVARNGLRPTAIGALQPIAYMIASYVLLKKTSWCLIKIGITADQDEEREGNKIP